MFGKAGKHRGKRGRVVIAAAGLAFAEQHHAGGHNNEGDNQRQRDAHGHHPAEIDYRTNITHHQREEGDNGSQHGVEAGLDHRTDGADNQLFLSRVRLAAVQFAVAHNQVHGQRQGDN